MSPLLELTCSRCGRTHEESARFCSMCGNALSRTSEAVASIESKSSAPHRATSSVDATTDARFDALRKMIPPAPAPRERDSTNSHVSVATASAIARTTGSDAYEPWLYLGIGLVTAPIFAWTPILQYMGWFLASLVHEMGHAAFAWLCGMPAVPAISIAGHAAAVHSEQSIFLAVLIALAIGAGAWQLLEGRTRRVVLGVLAIVYPSIAFTGAKELLHLLAGHAAELAFATLCLWKTLDGGFTESRLERALYGTVGWYLLGKNVFLCFGLMHSAVARAEYGENGSFGLTNDYIRAAEDVLSWPLERVALLMLVAGLLVLPAAIVGWRLSRSMQRA